MYLVHVPTLLAVMIAKEFQGWNALTDVEPEMDRLFKVVGEGGWHSNFALAFESPPVGGLQWIHGERHPVTGNWGDERGLHRLGGWGNIAADAAVKTR